MLYLGIVIAFLVLSYVYDYRGKEKDKLFWWIVMLVVLICVAGLRYKIGQDSIRYEKYYADTPELNNLSLRTFEQSRFGVLYVFLMSLCRTVSSDFVLFQFVEAIVVNSIFFYFIRKHTQHIFIAGLLYFVYLYFLLNMQVLREAFAASIFLLSWPFFVRRKWIPYFLMCLISVNFHISAVFLFFLPLLLLPGIREIFTFGKRTWVLIPVLIGLSLWLQYVLYDFIQLISLTDTISERAATYADSDTLGKAKLNIKGSIVLLFRWVLYPVIALYFLKKSRKYSSPEWKSQEVISMLGIYLCSMNIGLPLLYRYNDYFQIFLLILVSDWFYEWMKIQKKMIRLSFISWMIFLIPLCVAQVYSAYFWPCNPSGTIKAIDMYWPYTNQFDKEITPNRKRAMNYMRNK